MKFRVSLNWFHIIIYECTRSGECVPFPVSSLGISNVCFGARTKVLIRTWVRHLKMSHVIRYHFQYLIAVELYSASAIGWLLSRAAKFFFSIWRGRKEVNAYFELRMFCVEPNNYHWASLALALAGFMCISFVYFIHFTGKSFASASISSPYHPNPCFCLFLYRFYSISLCWRRWRQRLISTVLFIILRVSPEQVQKAAHSTHSS